MKTVIANKNIKLVGILFSKMKNPVWKLDKSNRIYKIPYKDCDKIYLGQFS